MDLASAFSLLDDGKNSEAKNLFLKALHEDKANPEALYGLGVCGYRAGALKDARKLLESCLRRQSRNYIAHYYLGLIAEKDGQPKLAVQNYRKAVSINPDFREAKERLSDLDESQESAESEAKTEATGQGDMETDIKIDSSPPQFRCRQKTLTFLLSPAVVLVLVIVIFVLLLVGGPPDLDRGLPASFLFFILISLALLWGTMVAYKSVTRYDFYQDRIEIQKGLLLPRLFTVWNFQVKSVVYRRNPLYWLIGGGTLVLELEQPIPSIGQSKLKLVTGVGAGVKIRGLVVPKDAVSNGISSSNEFMRQLWRELRDNSLQRRRSIKKWWL